MMATNFLSFEFPHINRLVQCTFSTYDYLFKCICFASGFSLSLSVLLLRATIRPRFSDRFYALSLVFVQWVVCVLGIICIVSYGSIFEGKNW